MDSAGGTAKRRVAALLAGLICVGLLAGTARAESRRLFTARRAVGVLFLGGGAVMANQALDLRAEADDFYDRYEQATEPEEIDRLYQRTNNRDIKSQLSWALAAAFSVTGLRLVLTSGPGSAPPRDADLAATPLPSLPGGLELTSTVDPQRIGLGLRRRFF